MTSTLSSESQLLKIDSRQRVRVSRERREAILDEFERSGLSGAAFAKLHGINYSTFASWSLKRRKAATDSDASAPSSGFAEIILDQNTAPEPGWNSSATLRVHLPGGAWLQLSGDPAHWQLAAQLLKNL